MAHEDLSAALGVRDSDTSVLDTPAAGPAALRGSALRTGGYALGVLLSVASAPLLIRHLGVGDFGRYVTVISVVTLAGGLTEAGLNAIALREYAARAGAERDAVMRNLLGIRLLLTGVGVAAAVGFAAAAGYDSVLVLGTLAAGAALVLQAVQTLLATSLQAGLRFGWVTLTELLRQVLTVGAMVGLVLVGAGLLPFLLVQIPAAAAALALTVWWVRGLMPLVPRFDRSGWWPLLRDTLPYAAAVALHTTYFRIAIIVMSLLATEAQTGYFATSFRVIEVLLAVPPLLVGAAFPILARAVRDDAQRFAFAGGRILELSLVTGVLALLGLELAAEPIVFALGGDEAEPSVAVLRLQAVALVTTFVAVAAGYILLSLRRHRELLVANGSALAVAVIAVFALVPAYEAEGAALATAIGEVTLVGVTIRMLARAGHDLAPLARAAVPILAAGGLAALVLLVPGLPPLADTAIGLCLFPLLLAAFGRFPPELGHALRGRGA